MGIAGSVIYEICGDQVLALVHELRETNQQDPQEILSRFERLGTEMRTDE